MRIIVTLLFSLFLVACGGGSGDGGDGGGVPNNTPAIDSFTSSVIAISPGSSADLTGIFSGGTGSINNGIGNVVSGASTTVSPTSTTTYILTVTDDSANSVTSSVTIQVVTAPFINSFTSSVTFILLGSSADLTVSFIGGSGSINNGVGSVTSGTQITVNPASTTTYVLTVTNTAGESVTSTVTVQVITTPYIQSFTSSAATISVGSSVNLTAVFFNGTGNIANAGGTITSGSTITVAPTVTTTYTLTVTSIGGSIASSSITINVVPLPVITGFSASATTISAGDSVNLTAWFSNGAGVIDNSGGVVTSGIPTSVTPTTTTTYTVTVTNIVGGNVTSSITIIVVPLPTITSFSASATTISVGNSVDLTGMFSNGTGVIDNGVGVITSGAIKTVSPSTTTTYTLTVTNSEGDQLTRTITVIVVPLPTISSTSPAASATDVATNSVITASFDQDIFASTVDASSFTLANNTNSANVSGVVSFNGNSNTATFAPSTGLALLTSHTARLSTSITGLVGNALAADYSWSFITADGAWKSAALIETDNAGDAGIPKIAFDSNGNALAVWSQNDGTRTNIWSNRYEASTGLWGTAALIESDNAGYASNPQIAIDSNGNALAVWSQNDGTRTNIWSNRYEASTGLWGTAALIETDNVGEAYYPQIAIDNNGNALAVWHQHDGTTYKIYSNRYEGSTGLWGSVTLIATSTRTTLYSPQIAIDSNGNALVVWGETDSYFNTYKIHSKRYLASTGLWSSRAALIESNAWSTSEYQIAIDSNGNALVVWLQHDGTGTYESWKRVYSNRYEASTDLWGSAVVTGSNFGPAYTPQIAIDSNGNALAVWRQHNGTSYNIYSRRYLASTGWDTTSLIETDAGDARNPQIAIDSNGNALAVWSQSDGARYNIYSNRYLTSTGSWGTAALIETDNAGSASTPQIAIDSNGNALAVWRQFDGTRYSFYSNRFE